MLESLEASILEQGYETRMIDVIELEILLGKTEIAAAIWQRLHKSQRN